MYKTIVFIINNVNGYITKYDPALFSSLNNIRLVLVVNESMLKFIEASQKKYFSKIYTAQVGGEGIYHKVLNEIELEKILENELSKLSNHKELLLITHNESCVFLCAKLRDKFNLSGMNAVTAQLFTNKIQMKKHFKFSGVRTPNYIEFNMVHNISADKYYNEIQKHIGTTFIIKPVCGAGSYGIKKINSLQDWENFYCTEKQNLHYYYAEEYIDGDLYHCDSLIKNNEIKITLCSKYNFPMSRFMEGKNVGSYPVHDAFISENLKEFNQKVLSHCELVDGSYHTEIFVEKNTQEFVFLESAARIPGGLVIQMYNKVYNINLLDTDLHFRLAQSTHLKEPVSRMGSFWAYIPPKEGIFKRIIQPNLKSHHHITWLKKLGDKLVYPESLKDRVGEIILWNSNYEELQQDITYISNNTFIEVE